MSGSKCFECQIHKKEKFNLNFINISIKRVFWTKKPLHQKTMYDNSQNSIQAASNHEEPEPFVLEEKRIVCDMNKTMEVKPYLKEYFYDFIVKNNNKYDIFSYEDAKAFQAEKKKMENKMVLTYLSMCFAFGGAYYMSRGLKKKSNSVLRHGVKVFSLVFLLPTIPANIASLRWCAPERENLLKMTSKYPIEDEKIFRDFLGYAQPKLKEKCYEELDRKKEGR